MRDNWSHHLGSPLKDRVGYDTCRQTLLFDTPFVAMTCPRVEVTTPYTTTSWLEKYSALVSIKSPRSSSRPAS